MRKQMIENAAYEVATQVRAVEDSIEAALAELAELQARMVHAPSPSPASASSTSHAAFEQLAATTSGLVAARGGDRQLPCRAGRSQADKSRACARSPSATTSARPKTGHRRPSRRRLNKGLTGPQAMWSGRRPWLRSHLQSLLLLVVRLCACCAAGATSGWSRVICVARRASRRPRRCRRSRHRYSRPRDRRPAGRRRGARRLHRRRPAVRPLLAAVGRGPAADDQLGHAAEGDRPRPGAAAYARGARASGAIRSC